MIRRIFTEEEVLDLELKAHGQVQYDLGRNAERERIITLLEALLKRTDNGVEYDDSNIGECIGIESAIALVKGQNK